jgi:hypothetical protein
MSVRRPLQHLNHKQKQQLLERLEKQEKKNKKKNKTFLDAMSDYIPSWDTARGLANNAYMMAVSPNYHNIGGV